MAARTSATCLSMPSRRRDVLIDNPGKPPDLRQHMPYQLGNFNTFNSVKPGISKVNVSLNVTRDGFSIDTRGKQVSLQDGHRKFQGRFESINQRGRHFQRLSNKSDMNRMFTANFSNYSRLLTAARPSPAPPKTLTHPVCVMRSLPLLSFGSTPRTPQIVNRG